MTTRAVSISLVGSSVIAFVAIFLLVACSRSALPAGPDAPSMLSKPPSGALLPMRGVWAEFLRPGYAAGYGSGRVVYSLNEFDAVEGTTVRSVVSQQLDMMHAMGINTIMFALAAADEPLAGPPPSSWGGPPICYVYPSAGIQYPHPTATELANLPAFFDLVQSKGIKIVLTLQNTHMEQPESSNALWLKPIIDAVKNSRALSDIVFYGDVHVEKFSSGASCGLGAEPPLWLPAGSKQVKYVKWAIRFAHSLGVPYSKLSAGAIVGANNTQIQPIVTLKQIFDALKVPGDQRSYAVSWYEHRKCLFAPKPCKDQSPGRWAATTMHFVLATVGAANASRVFASEYGDTDNPVDPNWGTNDAVSNLLSLWEHNRIAGGNFWIWSYGGKLGSGYGTVYSLPVLYWGVPFHYSAVQPLLQRYYTGNIPTPTPAPTATPVPTATPTGACWPFPGGSGILTDGDFHEAASQGTFGAGQNPAPGWTVTSNTIALISGGWTLGNICGANLDAGSAPGALAATLTTTPGTRYTVTFMLSGEPGLPLVKSVLLSAGGSSQAFAWNIGDYNDVNNMWGTESWTFTATAAQTILSLASRDAAGTPNGPVILGVAVMAAQ